MANTKSAKKRMLQDEERRRRNRAYRSRMRTAIKRLREAVGSGDAGTAAELLPETLTVIDVTAQKKVIHPNVAARSKSRLVSAVQALQGSQPTG